MSEAPSDQISWNFVEYPVADMWELQQVGRARLFNLMLVCPFSNGFEISTPMLRIEVDECFWRLPGRGPEPHLTHYSNVDTAHQLLPKNVETMSWKQSVKMSRHLIYSILTY